MNSEWQECTLGDFVRLQRGHDLTAAEQEPGNVPIMGSAGPNGSHSKALAKGPGVVIGRSGASAGRVHFSEIDYWPHNTCLYVTDFFGNNPRFAYYLLQTIDLASFNSGSAQPSLNRNFLYSIPLKIPARNIQNEIVKVLETLDDRITLLHETNTTLEAIAQALFKSWFVDFDPVHAKMQGRAPEGMDEATAALFPDSFEVSELGDVPKGWRFSTLGKSFELTMGQSPPGDTYNQSEDGLPFYQGRTDFGFRFPTKRIYCNAPTRLAEIGDALVSVRAPVGDVNMAIERCCIGRGVASVRHQSGCVGYTLYAMKNLGAHFKNFDTEGTIFGSINKKDFEALPVVVPSQGLLVAFGEISKALDGSIEINEQKIRGLVEIRDTLLPRLISGQISLSEVGQLEDSLA
jgi:type I restriction enzyme, S subunit